MKTTFFLFLVLNSLICFGDDKRYKDLIIMNGCFECHESQTSKQVGPLILFTNKEELKKELTNKDRDLMNQIKWRTVERQDLSRRMPLNRAPLSESDRDFLIKYLENLVK